MMRIEQRALLAEAIKSSSVDLEALAGFVRTNCPTYDLQAQHLALNCAPLPELTPRPSSPPEVSSVYSRLKSYKTHTKKVARRRRIVLRHRLRKLTKSLGLPTADEPDFYEDVTPEDRILGVRTSQDLCFPKLRDSAASGERFCSVRAYAGDQWKLEDEPKSQLKLQPTGQRTRDAEKQTSNAGDASQYSPDIQVQRESDTSRSTENLPMHMARNPNSTTDDICNIVLNAAFSTNLDELEAPTEAWQSVYWCVAELSHIVGHRNHHAAHTAAPSGPSGSSSSNMGGSSGQPPAKRKRRTVAAPRKGGSDNEDDMEDGQNAGPSRRSQGKKSQSDSVFTCPFRKRNPLRFNVRSHLNCATQTFPDISLLK